MAFYHHSSSTSNCEAMGSLDTSSNSAGTIAALVGLFDPDDNRPRSPMLQPRRLELKLSRSPSPEPTQVKPSRGDAVLMQYMGDGKNPDIYHTAGNQALSVSSEDGADDDGDYSDLEPEDDDKVEEQENEDTRMGGTSDKDANLARESQTEPVTERELLSYDTKEEMKVKNDSCGILATVSPEALTDHGIDPRSHHEDGMCMDDSLPFSESNGVPGDFAGMIAVAKAAVTAQKAKARPGRDEDDSNLAVDEPSAVAATTAQPEFLLASGESSPSKLLRYMTLDAPSRDDKKLVGADKRSPFGGDINTPGSRSLAGDSYAYVSTEHTHSTDSACQLPTPASMATPQESSSAIATLRDDQQMANSAAGTASFATPALASSPNEHSYGYPYSPNNFIMSRLPQPLPPIQYSTHYTNADSCTKPLSPTNINGIGENTPSLPSIHELGLGQDPVSDEQRRAVGVPTPDSYGRSYPNTHPHLPRGSLPSLSSIAHNHSTPPVSPNDAYHRSNDFPLSNNSATGGGGGSYYSSPHYGRRGSAALGPGGVVSPNRAHPIPILAARAAARAEAPAATPEPAPRQAPVRGKGRKSLGNPEKETMPAVNAALTTTTSHATPGTFKCKQPGCTAQPFQTQYLLNSHLNVHSDNRPHYCPVGECPRSRPGHGFKRKNEMKRHGLVHKSPGYVCPFCPDREHKYPRPDNLQRHVWAHHQDKGKDDPLLRDVLAQRPDGANQKRRRRLA